MRGYNVTLVDAVATDLFIDLVKTVSFAAGEKLTKLPVQYALTDATMLSGEDRRLLRRNDCKIAGDAERLEDVESVYCVLNVTTTSEGSLLVCLVREALYAMSFSELALVANATSDMAAMPEIEGEFLEDARRAREAEETPLSAS